MHKKKIILVPAFLYLLPRKTALIKLEILHPGPVDHPKARVTLHVDGVEMAEKEKWIIINKELYKHEHFCTSGDQHQHKKNEPVRNS